MWIVCLAMIVALLAPAAASAAGAVPLPPGCGFVPNRGQAPAEVLYYAAMPGGAVYLLNDGLVIDTWEAERLTAPAEEPVIRRRGQALWVRFADPGAGARLAAAQPLDTRLHCYLGSDPGAWRVGLPVFGQLTFRDLAENTDLVLTAGPGGVSCCAIAPENAPAGPLHFALLRSKASEPETLDAAGLARLLGGSAPASGALDNPAALVWSTCLGGSAEEIGWSAAVDAEGGVVVTGLNTSALFPSTPGAYDEEYSGLGDAFVAKISADGRALLWSTFLGGAGVLPEFGYAVVLDAQDNPIITGLTRSEDFPTTSGAFDEKYNGEADVFVSKLSADGSALLWSTFAGGLSHDIGYDLALAADGEPVVVGRTLSFDFPATPGAYDPDANGEEDGFILQLAADGSALRWSTFLGGDLYDGVQAVALDAEGAALLCGYTGSTNFPGGAALGLYDIFAAKLSGKGDALLWSRLIGGETYDYGTDLALDDQGDLVLCGSTGSADFPVTTGAFDESFNGADDAVAVKLTGSDGGLVWATFIGGTAPVYEIAHGVVLDAAGRPLLCGATPSADFPTTPDGFDTTHNGASDVFIARLSAAGDALEWGSFLGGPGDDYGYALARAGEQDVVTTGAGAEGYPVTAGAYDETYNGDLSDVFVSRIAPNAELTAVPGGAPTVRFRLAVSPTPLAGASRISFALDEPAAAAALELFDIKGRRCAALALGSLEAGAHSAAWSALARPPLHLAAGVYLLKLTAGGQTATRRLVVLK